MTEADGPKLHMHDVKKPKKKVKAPAPQVTQNKNRLNRGISKVLKSLHGWLAGRARLLSLGGGVAVVSLWTVIRHITNGVNFDVVGQIGLAQQWASGQSIGAQLGTTNYLFKMPFYFLVNQLHSVTPMNRILLLALACNVVTFLLLFLLFEKIVKLCNLADKTWLYLGMAWLASIAGNVFWVDYANSRNLETVGGLFFVYLALRYIKKRDWWLLPLMSIVGSITFFADTLQLYVCGVGVAAYALIMLISRRNWLQTMVSVLLITATAVGFLGSKLLFWLAERFAHVTFLHPPGMRLEVTHATITASLRGLSINTLKIFDADFLKQPYGFSTIRELLNAVVLLGFISLLVTVLFKVRKHVVVMVCVIIIVVNYLVYLVGGQAALEGTARYLVMVPLVTILLVSIVAGKITKSFHLKIKYLWLVMILASSTMLLGALAISWPNRHSKDTHIAAMVAFMHEQHFIYAIASRDIGVTTTYFAQGKAVALPFGCDSNHKLYPTNLFYDNAAFKGLYDYSGDVPVIIQENGIQFGTTTCSRADIRAQLGAPKREIAVPGIGTALIYDSANIRFAAIDTLAGHQRIKLSITVSQVTTQSTLEKLENCTNGSIDVVVAHPDDDILFMNPQLDTRLNSGTCVRTIYVTAADDGRQQLYWQNRERGIEASYATMLQVPDVWTTKKVRINDHEVVSRNLVGNHSLSLLYLRLPDGGVGGEGFSQNGYSSLEAIASNTNRNAATVDRATIYSYASLTRLVRTVIYNDHPTAIYTTVPSGELSVGDHSDHAAVGRLTVGAAAMAGSKAVISTFVGYPTNGMVANLSPTDSARKRAIFYAYAYDDAAICSSLYSCAIEGTYDKYFSRMYAFDILNLKQPPRKSNPVDHKKPLLNKNKPLINFQAQ